MERQRENLSQQEKVSHLCQMFNIRENEAGRILKECQNNLEMAIALLSYNPGGNAGFRGQDEAAPSHVTTDGGQRLGDDVMSPIQVVDQATGTQHNPIDLTGEGDQDLQKALALSLQDMNQPSGTAAISLEEQELSRALEASIADNNANMARMGVPMTSVFVDPLNPHDRKRERDMPVGLKNIGNTCWFSAVIQSLFHIPRFCQLILSYHPPPLSPSHEVQQYPHCVGFVLELQKLFAFLHHSQRKYISPDLAIQSLKEAFTKGYRHTGAQQDVSEFTHKLLEWIEDAFKLSHGPEESNPIVELFNGHSKSEGILNGQNFINESRFGAFPVQVQGHTHLHDSLDASTYTAELNQETWFTRLPPILVLELSRFQFNQASGQAEKVHDMLRFDRRLCLDRYLERNKEETRRRRIDVKKLKEKLRDLEGRLASYLHYDQKPISIIDTLTLTLKFVRQQGLVRGCVGEEEREGGGGERAGKRPRTSLHPVPRFVSSKEIEVMENSLHRWIGELTQDVDELQESIGATKVTLDAVYGDPLMNATPYHLHAVLVHQGQASGGHYWAYIRRLYNPYLPDIKQRTGSGSHDQSRDLEQLPVHDADVVLESHSESESQDVGESVQTEQVRTDITPQSGQPSGQGSHQTSQTGQTSGQSSHQTSQTGQNSGQDTSQTGQTSSLGRTESIESASDNMSESSQTTAASNRTHKTGSTGFRVSEGMDVDRGGVGSSSGIDSDVRGTRGDEEVWLKFNDVSVSEVGWDEVQRESLGGGRSNTSAYCLIYVSEAVHLQMKQGWRHYVSEELQQFVQGDNDVFSNEIAEFDEKQKKILPAQHIGSSDEMVPGGMKGPTSSPTSGLAPASLASAAAPPDRHRGVLGAARHVDRSPEQMQIDSPVLPPIDPQLKTELTLSMEHVMKQVHDLRSQGSYLEPRPLTLIAYVVLSKALVSVTKPLVLETVANMTDKATLQLLARREYVRMLSEPGMQDTLLRVRNSYQLFCCMCWNFVEAVKALRGERWGDGLKYSVHAYNLHTDISQLTGSDDFSLQKRHLGILINLRRQSLQGVGRTAYKLFENNNVQEALKEANSLLVPGLGALAANPCEGDMAVVEAVRGEWCQYLTHPGLTEEDQDQLGDLLTRLFDDSSQASSLPEPMTPERIDNHQLTVELSNALHQFMT